MDKQRFRIDKNEKLIALLEKRAYTNNYSLPASNGNATDVPLGPQSIMGKPVIVDAVPRDGQALIYNAEDKQWEAGTIVTEGMRGVAVFVQATKPTDVEVGDLWIQI